MGDITKEVRVFTYTDIKGPRRRSGAFGYVLETQTEKGPRTLTDFGKIECAAENGAELKTLIYALKRINQKCKLLIYTESEYVAASAQLGWLENWEKSDWKTAKGKEVANKEEWQNLLVLLNGQQFDFRVGEEHEYRQWLQREVKNKFKETEE